MGEPGWAPGKPYLTEYSSQLCEQPFVPSFPNLPVNELKPGKMGYLAGSHAPHEKEDPDSNLGARDGRIQGGRA